MVSLGQFPSARRVPQRATFGAITVGELSSSKPMPSWPSINPISAA